MQSITHDISLTMLEGRNRLGARMAIKAIHDNPIDQSYNLGASALYKSNVLATARNSMTKTHPAGSGFSSMLHAETGILSELKYHNLLPECTVYIVRLNKQNFIRYARPCSDCLKALINASIKTIVYSLDSGWSIEQL